MTALLDIRDLTVTFPGRRRQEAVTALSSLSLSLEKGESLSIIGESGSGKTTLMRAILGHVQPSGGSLRLFGTDVTLASDDEMTALRRRCAMVSQDPYGSLPPTLTVLDAVMEPWLIVRGRDTRKEAEKRARELHPYEVPCIVALPLVHGHAPFLRWITEETRPSTPE